MSFSYKSYNIANEITQNDAIPTQVPGFNLDTTATNYVYQRPLPFGLTYQGNQISELSTAKRNIYYNSINNESVPSGAKSVNLLIRGGQGGLGGKGGDAEATANSLIGSNTASGDGGNGGEGGWPNAKLTNSYSLNGENSFNVYVGGIGNSGGDGNSNSTNDGTTTGNVGGQGGSGETSNIKFSNNMVVDSLGGEGGGGGNGASANSNGYGGNTSSNQGNQGSQPDNTSTNPNTNDWPEYGPGQSIGYVQVVWLYD